MVSSALVTSRYTSDVMTTTGIGWVTGDVRWGTEAFVSDVRCVRCQVWDVISADGVNQAC